MTKKLALVSVQAYFVVVVEVPTTYENLTLVALNFIPGFAVESFVFHNALSLQYASFQFHARAKSTRTQLR